MTRPNAGEFSFVEGLRRHFEAVREVIECAIDAHREIANRVIDRSAEIALKGMEASDKAVETLESETSAPEENEEAPSTDVAVVETKAESSVTLTEALEERII